MADDNSLAALLEHYYGERKSFHDPMLDLPTPNGLPPLPYRGPELRAPGPRPADPMQPLYENLSPTLGAYGAGNLLAETYGAAKQGDWSGIADRLPLLLGMAAAPGRLARMPVGKSGVAAMDARGRALLPGSVIDDAARPRAGHPYDLYHGALEEYAPDPSTFRWFATNRGHASAFGDVTEHKAVFSNPAHLDAAKFEVPVGRAGDEWMYERANDLFSKGHDALFVRNWEGPEWTVLTRDDIERYRPKP